jgi:hypothetical protein
MDINLSHSVYIIKTLEKLDEVHEELETTNTKLEKTNDKLDKYL